MHKYAHLAAMMYTQMLDITYVGMQVKLTIALSMIVGVWPIDDSIMVKSYI